MECTYSGLFTAAENVIATCALPRKVEGLYYRCSSRANGTAFSGQPNTPKALMRMKSLFAGAMSLLALAACSGDKSAAKADSATASASKMADSAASKATAAIDTAKAAVDSIAKNAAGAMDSTKAAAAKAMDKAGDQMKGAADKMKPKKP